MYRELYLAEQGAVAQVVVAVAAVFVAIKTSVQNHQAKSFAGTHLLIPLVLSKLIRLLCLRLRLIFLRLLPLLFRTRGQIHLWVHLLHFCQITVHKIAQ